MCQKRCFWQKRGGDDVALLAPQRNPAGSQESGFWGCFTASVLASHWPALGLRKCGQNIYTSHYCVEEKELEQDVWILNDSLDFSNSTVETFSFVSINTCSAVHGESVCCVECELIVLNPNQSNELFQRTANVPSVIIWPSIALGESADVSKWHLVKVTPQRELKFSIVYSRNGLTAPVLDSFGLCD